jgi:uncharacterized membrane protein (GlpM family)
MGSYAIGAGLILIGLGGWGYLGAEPEHQSMTALIPAFFGAALALLGCLALKDNLRKHAMHAAAALGLLGIIAAVIGLVIGYNRSGSLQTRGAMASGGMALVCAIFVVLCVRSFIQVRKARRSNLAGSSPP